MAEKKQGTQFFWVRNLALFAIGLAVANAGAALTRFYFPDMEVEAYFIVFPIAYLGLAVYVFSGMAGIQGREMKVVWGLPAIASTFCSFGSLGFFAAVEAPRRTELFAMEMLVALLLVLTSLYFLKEAFASPKYQDLVFTATGGFGLFFALVLLNLV